MKKICTAFLAFFLAFSPLISVSPTVYAEAFDQSSVSSGEQTTEDSTDTTEAENSPEVLGGGGTIIPPLEQNPTASETLTTEAPTQETEASQTSGQQEASQKSGSTANESKPTVQPRTAFRSAVQSVPTTTDLTNVLEDVIVDASTDAEGNYIVRPNGEYRVFLKFAEKENLQVDNNQPLTYTFPVGFTMADSNNTFSIKITDSQGTATLDGNTFSVTNNVLTVNFNKSNQALFARLSAMANVKFELDFRGRFTGTETEINFGSSILKKFVFDQTSDIAITKESEHVKSEGKVKYTLKVTSTGNNSNVEIVDKMEGRSLTPNRDIVVTSSKHGVLQVTPVFSEKQFILSGINLEHEEVLTITYSATVDYNDISSPNVANESKNVASVKSTEIPEPKMVEKITTIDFNGLSKTPGRHTLVPGTTNLYQFSWTITVNEDQLMTVGGLEFKDNLHQPNVVYFTGTGISMVVTHENGGTENRTLTWEQLTVRKRADGKIIGWSYTPPLSDGKAKFVITAETIADTTTAIGSLSVNNGIQVGKRYTTPNKVISVGIGEELKPKKEIVSYSAKEALWKITIPVRAQGYNMTARVVDDVPYTIFNGKIFNDGFVDIEVQGLQEGESYKMTNRSTGQYQGPDIYFYQDTEQKVPGFQPSKTGELRQVTILVRTTINQEWLELAHEAGYATTGGAISPVHINNMSLRLGDSNMGTTARITPKKQTLKKVFKELKHAEIDGVNYPVFSYELEFTNPLDGQIISDEFDTNYLKYYQGGTLEIKGRNLEGDEFDSNGTVTPQVTSNGVNFTLTNLPKNNGDYYTTYRLTYELIVKDAETLEKLNKEAFQNENNQGKVLNNIASWNGITSDNVSTVYNYNPKLDKQLIQVPANSNNYVATFELILNKEAGDLFPDSNTYTAKDELSNVLRLLPETIQVTKGNYTLDYGFDAKTNTLTFNNIPDEEEVRIVYSAHVLGSGNVSFGNTVSVGQYKKTVNQSIHIASAGSGSASNPSITVVKHDKDEFSKVIPGVTFKLSYLKDGVVEDVKDKNGQVVTFTTKTDGTVLIEGNQADLGWVLWADGRTYLLTEVNTPTGYLPLEQPISFTILETPTNTSQYPLTDGKIYVANERPKTRVEATKIWKNIGPGLVVPTTWFKLYRQIEGGALEPVPNAPIMTLASGTNSVVWENVYAKDLNNNPYTFSVKEVDANGNEATPQDYLKQEEGLQVTNTYDGRREIEVTKVWSDNNNQDGKRPSEVIVHLYADNTKIKTANITAANSWKYTFTNLPRFKDGREIVYTIQEEQVPEYNAPEIDGFTVTNKRNPEKTSISVQKIWEDANNQDGIRPLYITVILKANGIEIDRKVLTSGPLGIWNYEFTNLDVYKNGVKVNYTVDEEVVPDDYSKMITGDATGGFTITNTHTPVEKQVTFSKVDLGGKEIGGAKIKIYKGTEATGNPVAEWSSVEGQSHQLNLPVGTYVFHEEAAPNGYLAVTDITFKVNYDGTVTVLNANSNTADYKDGKLVITDQYDESPKKITFSKVNLGGEEIAGAVIEIYAGDTATGTPVEKWTSEAGKSKVIDLTPGTYVFHEEAAPNGYLAVTDITFKVNYDGTVTVLNANSNTADYKDGKLVITDQYDESPKKITFSKVNLGGEEIAGAAIEIYAGDTATGTPVEKWTSEAGKSKVIDLTPGTYVFHEEAAPNGYLAVTDITFKVNYDGTVTVLNANSNTADYKDGKLVITDQYDESPKKITFSKVNLGGEEIAGAAIEIYAGDTATGTPVEKWTSEAGKSKVIDLTPGTYVFHEEAAPNGYLAVTDITFKVNYDGTVTVLNANSNTADYKDGKLVITDQYDESPKKITFSKVNLGGEEIAGAAIEIYAGDTATGTPVEKWTSEAGKSKVIDLTPGTYVFHEEAAPNGYLAVTDITFKVNYDGTVTVLNANSNTADYKDGKLVITDQYDESPKKITFSKVNLGGEEIAGAAIEIYAGDTATGTPVEKWTSEAGKSKVIDLTPGTYVFHEEAAPNGYLAVTDITFKVNYDGTVTVLNANSNTADYKDGKLVITDQYDESPKKITFSKVNLGGEEIAGAAIEIYAGDTATGTPVEKWTSEAGKSKVIDLTPGTYVFHEEAAPNGYLAVTDITFKVNYDGTVTVLNANSNTADYKDGKLVITDQYDESPKKITFSKVNLGGEEIAGAAIEIYAGDTATGTPVEKWTSEAGKSKVIDLTPGTYVFHEEAAPNGYLAVTDITFKVNYDGTVTVLDANSNTADYKDGKLVITDQYDESPKKITFSKVNLGGEEIAGAAIEIYAGETATGTPVEKWTSEAGKSKVIDLTPGTYVFHEEAAPNGYLAVTDITFKVNYDGTVTVLNANSNTADYKDGKLVITDQYDESPKKITFSKVNLGGEEIAGAAIEIYAGDTATGTPVEKWTSEAGKSKVIDLTPGTYVFHEEAAPNGYLAVTDITFKVNYDGTVTVLNANSNTADYKDGKLVITDQYDESPKKITFSKVNLGGEEIAGAAIEIYAGDTATGTPVEKWTSEAGKSKVIDLTPGTYVFHEEAAPNGYLAVTDITFKVNYDGTVTVLNANSNTADYKDGKLVITDQYDESPKKITFSKVNLGGEEIAGAAIEIYAGDTATGTPVEKWTSEAGKSKVIDLTPGTYVFHEEAAPNGYLAVTDITFKVNYDGTVTVLNANSNTADYKDGKLVITDQYDESPKKITFSKVNLGGEEIAGAAIEIYAGDTATGTPVEKWTSEAGKSKVIDLTPGTYVFHEEAAPNGYLAVTDITFKVNYDGTVTVLNANSNTADYKDGKLVITDQYDESPKKITFSKVNLGGEEIAGAAIEIYAGDTATGTPVEKWTSEAGKSKVIDLTPGTYVFHEEAAPNGYLAVTDITFKVNYDGTVTVLNANSNTADYKDGKLVITDQYDESTIDILVTKKWEDQANKDGKRPKKIIVRLFADGQEVAHQEVTADTDWKQTFTKLPKYKNGKEIVYTITEDKVDGYQTVISGNVAKGFVIQNTYTPPTPPPSTSIPKGKVGRNSLPRTGDNYSLLLSGIGFIILVIGLFDRRKKRM